MAEIKYTTEFPRLSLRNTVIALWEDVTGADTTNAWASADYADKTVHMYGDWTGGGSITLEGSNDPRVITDPNNAVWEPLTAVGGAALTVSGSDAIKVIAENPYFIKATPSGTIAGVTISITGKRVK